MLYYKDEFTQSCMNHKAGYPRFARLARKAISHYVGDRYDPKTFNPDIELSFRSYIRDCVMKKIESGNPYDWLLIDYVFREFLKKFQVETLSDDILKQKSQSLKRKGAIFYNDDLTEKLMHDNTTLPRYRFLARKAISHYLGDRYNPEEIDPEIEFTFRQCIAGWIELKVVDKEPYDWPIIDHFLRYVLNEYGYTDITYDQSILDKGYNGVMRGELPQYHA